MLHKDFLMAEFKFMQVKITFDDKLKVVEFSLEYPPQPKSLSF